MAAILTILEQIIALFTTGGDFTAILQKLLALIGIA